MALAITNTRNQTGASGGSTTLAYSGAVSAGSVLVAGGWNYNGSASPASPAISDSVNGSWTVRKYAGLTADANDELWLATFDNSGAGTPTVTWNPNGASADMGGWFIAQVTGAANPSLDVTPATSQQTTITPSIASGTLAQADEILFAVMTGFTENGTVTITKDATYTELANQPDNATSQMGEAQYKIVAVTTTDTADWTVTDGSSGSGFGKVSILISLKQAAAGGATSRPVFRSPGSLRFVRRF
jgi:hypothetical protein